MKIISIVLLLLVLIGPAGAASWQFTKSVDAMTDQIVGTASVQNSNGDKLSVVKRDNTIWVFLELARDQFGVSSELIIRIDKNKPKTHSQELEDAFNTLNSMLLTEQMRANEGRRRLNMAIEPLTASLIDVNIFEWNPDLIGAEIWGGGAGKCQTVDQLLSGSRLVVRYNPSQSTSKDLQFSLRGSSKAISNATGYIGC